MIFGNGQPEMFVSSLITVLFTPYVRIKYPYSPHINFHCYIRNIFDCKCAKIQGPWLGNI